MTDSFAEDQSSVLSFRAKIWEMTYALRSFAVSMNWRSSINCTTTALMIEQSSLFIVPSIWCTQPKILLLQFTKLETVWRYILIKNRHKAINILQHTNVLSLYTKNIKPILRWPKGSCKTYEIPFPKYLAYYAFGIDWLKKPLVFTYGLSAYFYISWAIPLAFLIELLLDLWRKWFNLGKLDDNLLFFILFSSRLKFTIIVSVYTYPKYIIFLPFHFEP